MDFRNLSQAASEQLSRIRNHSRIPRESAAKLLIELGDFGEVAVLPELAEFLLYWDTTVRNAAQEAVFNLLRRVPGRALPELDMRMRERYRSSMWGEESWPSLQPRDISSLAAGLNAVAVQGLASMHGNGRVREAAVLRIAEHMDGSELPFLLLRLNDWVEEVRDASRTAIARRLTPEYAPHFLPYLGLVARLERCSRDKHDWILRGVANLLLRPECACVLQSGLNSPDKFTRRTCLQLIVQAGGIAVHDALRKTLSDREPMLRLWAVKQLLIDSDPRTLVDRNRELLTDPFMPVRREVLQAMAERDLSSAVSELIDALLDRYASVRDVAQFYLKRNGGFDAREFYRSRLGSLSGRARVSAIYGLGESGQRSDVDLLLPYLSSSEIRTRCAAVSAVARLDAKGHLSELLSFIADESPRVFSAASRALLPYVGDLDRECIVDMLNGHLRYFVRKNALSLVLHFSKWEQLPLILRACRDASDAVSNLARSAVSDWLMDYNRAFVPPNAVQIEGAENELRQSQEFLETRTVEEIFALISGWSQKP